MERRETKGEKRDKGTEGRGEERRGDLSEGS
jgi:hypothetical protein